MKKPILLLLSLLLLTACGGKTAVTEGTEASTEATVPTVAPTEPPTENPYAPIGDENTFLLPALPDIGEYEAGDAERWYKEYTPDLIPSEQYGTLVPYVGRAFHFRTPEDERNEYNDNSVTRYSYGLCTMDGVIVTDPTYESIRLCPDGYYVLMKREVYHDFSNYCSYYLAATDGSFCRFLVRGHEYYGYYNNPFEYVGEGIYCLTDERGEERYCRLADGDIEEVYVGEDVCRLELFDEGLLLGHSCEDEDYTAIFDKNFNRLTDWHYNMRFYEDGVTFLYTDERVSQKFGVADIHGRQILQNVYNDINRVGDEYRACDDKNVYIFDKDGALLRTLTPAVQGEIKLVGDEIFYVRGDFSDYTYFDYEGNVIDGDGVHLLNNGMYLTFRGNETVIHDESYNELVTVRDVEVDNCVYIDGRLTVVTLGSKDGYGYLTYYRVDMETGELTEFTPPEEPPAATSERDPHLIITRTTPAGELSYYSKNGCLLTLTEDGQTIISLPDDTEA